MTRNDHEDHVRTAMGAEHVFHRSTEARPPVAVQGEGIYLIDEQGRRYIDACGGAVYLVKGAHPPVFRPVAGPGANERQRLVEQIAAQVGQARLPNPDPARVTVVEGDVLDRKALEAAMKGQDVVYANLSGAMAQQARAIVAATRATGLTRLIFISSMGIYDEVPGEKCRSVLDPIGTPPQ